jgi:tetratricopeptide (TPR) repeat protein
VVSAGKFGDGEMVVKGLSYGNAKIIMRSLGGNLIELDVFVRGRMDDREEMISQARISDAERKRLAEMAHQAGNIHMGKGRPFLALQEYQAGVSYLKHVADKGALYVTLRDEARKAEKTVQDRYTQYAQQARQAHSVGDYTKALDLINLIIDLIPDQNDPRHQRARDFLQRWELEKAPKKK